MGSIISFIALLLFIFLLWEAFRAQRGVLISTYRRSFLEWSDILPLDFHNRDETLLITRPNLLLSES